MKLRTCLLGLVLAILFVSCIEQTTPRARHWLTELRAQRPLYEDSLSYVHWAISDFINVDGGRVILTGPHYIGKLPGILATYYQRAGSNVSKYEWYLSDDSFWSQKLIIPRNYQDSMRPTSPDDLRYVMQQVQGLYGAAAKKMNDGSLIWDGRNTTLTYCDSLKMIRLTVGPGSPTCASGWAASSDLTDSIIFRWQLPQSRVAYMKQWAPVIDTSSPDARIITKTNVTLWGIPGRVIASYNADTMMRIGWTTDQRVDLDKYFEIRRDLTRKLGDDTVHTGSSIFWRPNGREYRLKYSLDGEILFSRNR